MKEQKCERIRAIEMILCGQIYWVHKRVIITMSRWVYDICRIKLHDVLSCVWLFGTPWIVAHQVPLSMGFSRQGYWSGVSFPPPGDLPDPGIQPTSPSLVGGFFTTEPPGKPPKLHDSDDINIQRDVKWNYCILKVFILWEVIRF